MDGSIPVVRSAWLERTTIYDGGEKKPLGGYDLILRFDSLELEGDGFDEKYGVLKIRGIEETFVEVSKDVMSLYLERIPPDDTLYLHRMRSVRDTIRSMDSLPLIKRKN